MNLIAVLFSFLLALCPYPADALERLGFGFDAHSFDAPARYGHDSLSRYDLTALYGDLPSGWYYDWGFRLDGAWERGTLDYAVQMLWSVPHTETLRALAANNPGDVFVVGNEPDVRGQMNMTPARYAVYYHDAHNRIKFVCPECRVAIAGMVSASPLRLAYLDRVYAEYKRLYGTLLPVDIYTIHGYNLCERCGHVPPGMMDLLRLADIDNFGQGDFAIFKQRILAMREWMAAHGERDTELWLTEFGVLGFDDVGTANFMLQSIPWALQAFDDSGMSTDEYRLIQRMAWFSLNENRLGGALFDKTTTEATPLANLYRILVAEIKGSCVKLEGHEIAPIVIATALPPTQVYTYYFPIVRTQ